MGKISNRKHPQNITVQVPADYKFKGAEFKRIIDACFQRIYDQYGDIFTAEEKEALSW